MKDCIIYYGTIVETVGNWAVLGAQMEEPVSVEGQRPLGRPPDFCCEKFKVAYDDFDLSFSSRVGIVLSSHRSKPDSYISFCPYCGAKIVLLEDLKLRVIKTERLIVSHHVGKV